MFPRSFTLTKDHVNELRDILVHAMGGNRTSFSLDSVIFIRQRCHDIRDYYGTLQRGRAAENAHSTKPLDRWYFFVVLLQLLLKFLIENVSSDLQGTTCVLSQFPIYEGPNVTHYARSR